MSILGSELSHESRVFALLRKRAEDDDDADVRTTAVRALAEGFAQHPRPSRSCGDGPRR